MDKADNDKGADSKTQKGNKKKNKKDKQPADDQTNNAEQPGKQCSILLYRHPVNKRCPLKSERRKEKREYI
jgi:hypothetical protein